MLRLGAYAALLTGLVGCASAPPPAPSAAPQVALLRAPPAPVTPAAPRAVELTFLRSEPGQHERLVRFLEANWLALDHVAIARGLFVDARLLEARDEGASDPTPWDVVVVVTYRDTRGYEGVRAEFDTIRRAHPKQLIDGHDLATLGRIVAARSLVESPPPVTRPLSTPPAP
ncbi:MAG: hypothetical protein MUF34_14130 [Polyangiaceae bacterium]|nr:hypothetical protein [Polyangiaceae bacterium]